MKKFAVTILAAGALLVVPSSALAASTSGGSGEAFGQHHAAMAQDGHLGAGMTPGMHKGFSGWTPM